MANTTETVNLCGLKREDFQTTINGKKTDLYILRNRKGYEVAISNYGGAICAITQTMEVPFVLLWFQVRMAK